MKKQLFIIILSLITFIVKGQSDSKTITSWLPAISLGETADFTSGFSARGIEYETSKHITEDITLGFAISWNVFREKVTDELLDYNDAVISGVQFRYFNTIPLNLKFKKYFNFNDFEPFLGLGIGPSYSRDRTDIGIYSSVDDKWQFNIAPEIGSLVEVSSGFALALKIKYNYSPKAGDFHSVSYLSFGIGFSYR
jgi:hypothetical protein